jgi:SAM-dependent methyltransferase
MTHVADSSRQLLASYEALPYQGDPIPATNPDSVAAMVRLRGLRSPDVRRCRVLDLGCSTGGNIISMAVEFPHSTFVGVDFSPRQIETARRTATQLGLSNVRFEVMSIADVDQGLGTFDYIVSHGVYSWVPAEVQRALLRVCSENLAPDGIAYVSYNTEPGWHLRGLVREMLLLHDRPDLPAEERVARGRELVEFMATTVPDSQRLYSALLQQEFALLKTLPDSYFLHEELETENSPIYFREFVERARQAGLRYISEATPSSWDAQLTHAVLNRVKGWASDEVTYEQYLDFLRGRSFRRSLLCHANVNVANEVSPRFVESLYFSSRSIPGEPPADAPKGAECFRTPDGVAVTLDHAVALAALHTLVDTRPARLSFDELFTRVRDRLGTASTPPLSSELLADVMLRCALVTLVRIHTVPAPCATKLSLRPVASSLARLQAVTGRYVTSLTNQNLDLDSVARLLVVNADGTCEHKDFVQLSEAALARGEMASAERSPPTPEQIPTAVTSALESLLVNGVFSA